MQENILFFFNIYFAGDLLYLRSVDLSKKNVYYCGFVIKKKNTLCVSVSILDIVKILLHFNIIHYMKGMLKVKEKV